MTTDLVPPFSLAGLSIGDSIDQHDLSAFLEDGEEEGCSTLTKLSPYVSIILYEGVVISVTAADECWLGGVDLIGMPATEAVDRLGIEVVGKAGTAVEIWALLGGIEVYSRDGVVTRVSVSDWSLIVDETVAARPGFIAGAVRRECGGKCCEIAEVTGENGIA
jgi:hypothetical protein